MQRGQGNARNHEMELGNFVHLKLHGRPGVHGEWDGEASEYSQGSRKGSGFLGTGTTKRFQLAGLNSIHCIGQSQLTV